MVKTLRKVLAGFTSAALLLLALSCGPKADEGVDVASVTFSPAGGDVNVNGYVTLSCETEGAEIYWSKTQQLTSSNFSEGTPGSSVQVTSDDGTSFTLYAIAVYTADSGTTYCSEGSSAAYTVKYSPTVTTDNEDKAVVKETKVTITANPAYDGDTVILYYTTDGTALTSENYAAAGTKVEMAEGATVASVEINITEETAIYAVAVDTTQNTVSEVFYKIYSLQLEKQSKLVDGDVIIILYSDGTKNYALTNETSSSSSSKLYGKYATVTDDILEANDSFARLTVKENKAGQFVLVSNGKYLTSGSTGNSLAYSDTYSCYALWEQIIETDTDSGLYYMDNANAIYNSNRQRLEYYSGFTTYNQKSSSAYEFTFWKDPNATAETVDMTAANKIETPVFSLEATDNAMQGAKVYVTSASLNATVYYSTSEISIDGSFDLAALTDASDGFNLPEEASKESTYYAVAAVSYTEDSTTKYLVSDVASVTYTTSSENTKTLTKVTDKTSIEEDSVVAINYTSSDGTTCISLVNSDGSITTEESLCTASGLILTDTVAQFTVKKDEDYYVFVNDGKFLTGNESLSLSSDYTEYAKWEISTTVDETSAESGNFFLKNIGSEKYIEYYTTLTLYKFDSSKSAIYNISLYKNEDGTAESITLPLTNPELSSDSGEIPTGTKVTATTSVEGASVYYKWIASSGTDSAPAAASEITEELSADGISIEEAGTLYVVSKKDSRTSAIVTASYTVFYGAFVDYTAQGITTQTAIAVDESWTVGDITATTVKATVNKQSYGYQIYANGSAKIESASGKKILKIVMTSTAEKYCVVPVVDSGTVTADTTALTVTWTADNSSDGADSVTLTPSKQLRIASMKVYYAETTSE